MQKNVGHRDQSTKKVYDRYMRNQRDFSPYLGGLYFRIRTAKMEPADVWIKEYDHLWDEKILHKTTLRKFHNYLTYMAAVSTLALTFYGVSSSDVMQYAVGSTTTGNLMIHGNDIIRLLSVVFVPIVLITLTFPLNDMFHIYAMAAHIAVLERKINSAISPGTLSWESEASPHYYAGKSDGNGKSILNVIIWGDFLILFPALIVIGATVFRIAFRYLKTIGPVWRWSYVVIVVYLFLVVVFLGIKAEMVRRMTRSESDDPLAERPILNSNTISEVGSAGNAVPQE